MRSLQLTWMIYSAAEGKLNVKSEEMPPVPKRRRIPEAAARSFLGLCTFYKRFGNGFTNIAPPMHSGNSVGFQAGDLVWLCNPRRRRGRPEVVASCVVEEN